MLLGEGVLPDWSKSLEVVKATPIILKLTDKASTIKGRRQEVGIPYCLSAGPRNHLHELATCELAGDSELRLVLRLS